MMAEARPHCYRCDKPASMCLCGHLTPIPNEVGVHVLQHPRERRHPLGTARLLRLGLASVSIHGLQMEGRSAVCVPVSLPQGAALLYPSEDARDLASLTVEERPKHLVVIDGTWAQAHRIFRDNPWVSALPCYRLAPDVGSRYRIRIEPRLECLSTVESVVAALRCLHDDLQGTETLISAFDAMIDDQIAASKKSSTHFHGKRTSGRPTNHIPHALLASDARIVVAYTETAPPQRGDSGPPFRLSAVSLDGEVFDRMVQTKNAPDAYLSELMGLESQALDTAQPIHQVMAEFREFCEGSRCRLPRGGLAKKALLQRTPLVLVSWNVKTQRWLEERMGDATCISLKAVWANISRARVPALDKLVGTLGLATEYLPVTGRAGRRLSQAHAMTRHILDGANAA
ncbi:MAG: DTW domain-containing protein [Proteobacteria bacterium]|jgi:DTW domain-containing protein|nr:DTW domain-containing protein [Pseudomonadota bacterium]